MHNKCWGPRRVKNVILGLNNSSIMPPVETVTHEKLAIAICT